MQHRNFMQREQLWAARRRSHLRREVEAMVEAELHHLLLDRMESPVFHRDLDQVQSRRSTPQQLAREILRELIGGEGGMPK